MDQSKNEQVVDGYVVRLNGRAWGWALGLLSGLGLFIATNILILKGGQNGQEVGQHLGLLNQYLPGFEVTFLGSLIGLLYGLVLGYLLGRLITTVYNLTARR